MIEKHSSIRTATKRAKKTIQASSRPWTWSTSNLPLIVAALCGNSIVPAAMIHGAIKGQLLHRSYTCYSVPIICPSKPGRWRNFDKGS
jgi:hypothetical protein